MAIKGSLSEASLTEVIQLICVSNKTGCLSVTDGTNFGTIFIKDGKIALANLTPHKRRIGDILVQSGKLSDADLKQAINLQKENRNKKLGTILIEMNVIGEEDLVKPLRLQTEDALFSMLMWNTGYFSFEPGLLPGKEEAILNIPYEGLLIESTRRIDEWKEIEDKLPPEEVVLIRKKSPVQLELTDNEKAILDLVDDKRSLAEIISSSSLTTLETCKAVHVLLTAGHVSTTEPKKETAKVEKERREVGIAFYKTKMYQEAIRELSKLEESSSENPEINFYLGLSYYRTNDYKQAVDLLSNLGENETALFNIACTYWRMDEFDEAISILEKIKEAHPADSKALAALGIVHFDKGMNAQAKKYFMQLKEKDPQHYLPYFYLPLIFTRDKDYETALKEFEASINKFPSRIELRNNLALLYEAMGKNKDVEQVYRDAVKQDPFSPLLRKNFGTFYYNRNVIGAAREQFEAIEESARDWEIYFRLGNINLKLGNRSEALEYYKKAKELNPEDSIIERNLKILKNEETE